MAKAKTPVVHQSKSDWMRDRYAEGMTIKAVVDLAETEGRKIGYAFAYGVAERAGLAQTLANRRPAKSIAVQGDLVTITIADGTTRIVNRADGSVKKGK